MYNTHFIEEKNSYFLELEQLKSRLFKDIDKKSPAICNPVDFTEEWIELIETQRRLNGYLPLNEYVVAYLVYGEPKRIDGKIYLTNYYLKTFSHYLTVDRDIEQFMREKQRQFIELIEM